MTKPKNSYGGNFRGVEEAIAGVMSNTYRRMDVLFTEYDVSRDQSAANDVIRLSGQMGVPVIVVDGNIVIGFDKPRLDELLI